MTEAKQIKDMSSRDRVLLLRLNTRRAGDEGKRLTGKVSEALTDFKNTLTAPVPSSGAECKAILQRLQLLNEEVQNAKDKRSAFKAGVKTTQHALLFSEISEGGQMVLPGAELELAPEQLRDLKLAVSEVKLQDQQAKQQVKDDPEAKPKYPVEDESDLAELEALLDAFASDSGITAASLGAKPEAPPPKPEGETKRGGRKALAVAPMAH